MASVPRSCRVLCPGKKETSPKADSFHLHKAIHTMRAFFFRDHSSLSARAPCSTSLDNHRPTFLIFLFREKTSNMAPLRHATSFSFASRRSLLLALSHLASLDNARPARCAIDSWRAPLAPQPRSLTSASFFPPSHPLLPFFRPRHLDAASAVAALRAAAAGHVRRWRGRPGGGGGAARCVGAGRPLGRAGRGSGP